MRLDRALLGLLVAGALYLALDSRLVPPAPPQQPEAEPTPRAAAPELRLLGWPRRVGWDEFETRRIHPWGQAETLASIRSTIEVRALDFGRVGARFGVTRAEVAVGVARGHSWVRASDRTEYVRAHEQGHFDITGLVAREWLDALGQIRSASEADARAEAARSAAALGEKLALLQRLYDHEAYGGEEPQRAWLERIARAAASGRPLPAASQLAGYGALGGSLDPY